MTSTPPDAAVNHIVEFGYALLRGVFVVDEMQALAARLTEALAADEPSVLRSSGRTYGSRDLVRLLPDVCDLPRKPSLKAFVRSVLGPQSGLVRALYFDKPPDRSWSLPWHKDRTIAVHDNTRGSGYFRRPTTKAGIPHVEAPEELLTEMLTLRIHLDPMTADNGPLSVMPGTHRNNCDRETPPVEIHCHAGDVLAMRPLLSHSSSLPAPGITLHRRVIHLELAPRETLPDGYCWHSFDQIE